MPKSSISKHFPVERRSALAEAIGCELRRLRRRRGLTQGELGTPFTRAFVSSVELGYTIPSVPALVTLTERLGIGLDDFFWGVNQRWTGVYTAPHEDHNHSP
ncbi:MAG TPA: helix-turn-helix transcriptional regulator [Candidatus Limnocylindrales bacterium]|nr:helix-turn-helix transcriptional regulator [Candidatus Limnocylindrales bacterium]